MFRKRFPFRPWTDAESWIIGTLTSIFVGLVVVWITTKDFSDKLTWPSPNESTGPDHIGEKRSKLVIRVPNATDASIFILPSRIRYYPRDQIAHGTYQIEISAPSFITLNTELEHDGKAEHEFFLTPQPSSPKAPSLSVVYTNDYAQKVIGFEKIVSELGISTYRNQVKHGGYWLYTIYYQSEDYLEAAISICEAINEEFGCVRSLLMEGLDTGLLYSFEQERDDETHCNIPLGAKRREILQPVPEGFCVRKE